MSRSRLQRVVVITPVHGRHPHLLRQHRSLSAGTRAPDLHVVVALEDEALVSWRPTDEVPVQVVSLATEPEGLPLAAARNRGAEAALRAGADCMIFLDVDCLAGAELVAEYDDAVAAHPEVVWSGPVTYLDPPPSGGYDLTLLPALDEPHPARPAPSPGTRWKGGDPDQFWSLSFALAPSAWTLTGGFCEYYRGYGGEDTDFGSVIAERGLELGWTGGARAYHQHHPTIDPPLQHLEDIVRNAGIFYDRWGRWPMRGWLEEFARRGLVGAEEDGWPIQR